MRIALTGADTVLGRTLARRLGRDHEVRAVDAGAVDLLDSAAVTGLCQDMEAAVLLPPYELAPAAPDDDPAAARLLDVALQGTGNLLGAAREAGARRVVQVSDVCVYEGYDEGLMLSEDMVALPSTAPWPQALHLAEGIAHEFGRETPGLPLTLRLGRLVDVLTLPADAPLDPDWLDLGDAADAVARGLELESFDHPAHWGLYNLVADTPLRRFALRITQGRFACKPGVDFRAWWPEDAAGGLGS